MPPDKEKELKEWEKANKKSSPKLRKKPKLFQYQRHLLDSFFDMSRRRQFSMTPLPLTIEAIFEYGKQFGFEDDLRFFFRVMSALDDSYIERQAKAAKEEKESAKNKAPPSRGRRGK